MADRERPLTWGEVEWAELVGEHPEGLLPEFIIDACNIRAEYDLWRKQQDDAEQ